MNIDKEKIREWEKWAERKITLDSLMHDCYQLLKDTREFDGEFDEQLYNRILDFRDDLIAATIFGVERIHNSYRPIIDQIHHRYIRKLERKNARGEAA